MEEIMSHQVFTMYHQIGNTYEFLIQYIVNICCAIIAALAISPIVTIVDKSVIQSANNKESLINVLMKELKKIVSS